MSSTIKDLFYVVVVLFCLKYGLDYIKENKVEIKQTISSVVPDSKSSEQVTVVRKTRDNNDVSENTTETSEESQYNGSGVVVYVHGLGDYSSSDLLSAKQAIENFYGVRAIISSSQNTDGSMYEGSTGVLLAYKILQLGSNYEYNSNHYHMYFTSEPLCQNGNTSDLISGHAFVNGHTSVISTGEMVSNAHYSIESVQHTVNHELAHNFGLDHCNDQGCLMKSHGLDTKTLCSNCRNKLKL